MKKALLLGLSLLLCVGLLAGCGPAAPAGASATPAVSASSSPTPEGQTAQPSDTPVASADPALEGSALPSQAPGSTATAQPQEGKTVPPQSKATVQPAATRSPTAKPAAPAPTKAPTAAPTDPPKQTITVTVSIDCKTAVNAGYDLASQVSSGGVILGATKVELDPGATVYDALKKVTGSRGIPVGKVGSGSRIYIASINSLGEGDCGSESGWMYSVNGGYPGQGCGKQVLQSGDKVQWRYTLNLGGDLGAPVG